ncbi:hypothetical protein JOL62DRAFT_390693 [Phyllosticta paracitricarpa]|uniref:Secreted protein n=1 Tax=Phyllosticta paracitricarpa TaxID=2016321 RepID=A0ABR1NFT4_9PEZI
MANRRQHTVLLHLSLLLFLFVIFSALGRRFCQIQRDWILFASIIQAREWPHFPYPWFRSLPRLAVTAAAVAFSAHSHHHTWRSSFSEADDTALGRRNGIFFFFFFSLFLFATSKQANAQASTTNRLSFVLRCWGKATSNVRLGQWSAGSDERLMKKRFVCQNVS